jgi:hypothetical protein
MHLNNRPYYSTGISDYLFVILCPSDLLGQIRLDCLGVKLDEFESMFLGS